jgi:hypothetical protein
MKAMAENRHPVDRLADLRVQIALLTSEADKIRRKILSGEIEPRGDEYEAILREQNRIDLQEVHKRFGPAVDDCRRPYDVLMVVRRGIRRTIAKTSVETKPA